MTPILTSSIPRHRGGRGDGAASARRHQARPRWGVGLRARRLSPGVAATPGFPLTRPPDPPPGARAVGWFLLGATLGAGACILATLIAEVIA